MQSGQLHVHHKLYSIFMSDPQIIHTNIRTKIWVQMSLGHCHFYRPWSCIGTVIWVTGRGVELSIAQK